jgi:hypothetical protein
MHAAGQIAMAVRERDRRHRGRPWLAAVPAVGAVNGRSRQRPAPRRRRHLFQPDQRGSTRPAPRRGIELAARDSGAMSAPEGSVLPRSPASSTSVMSGAVKAPPRGITTAQRRTA